MATNKDPGKGHFFVSLTKSVVRGAAGGILIAAGIVNNDTLLLWAGVGLVVAEILGILEELV